MLRLVRILLVLLLFPPFLAAGVGWLVGPAFLHPFRRDLTPDLIRRADAIFLQMHAHGDDFEVRAPDGIILRGWKLRAAKPHGDWVLVFHGVGDNRMGVV